MWTFKKGPTRRFRISGVNGMEGTRTGYKQSRRSISQFCVGCNDVVCIFSVFLGYNIFLGTWVTIFNFDEFLNNFCSASFFFLT